MQLQLFEVEAYDSIFRKKFLQSELGMLYSTIPFQDLAVEFKKDLRRFPQGSKPIFSIEGGIGLMFLKNYTGLSDTKLIDRVNTDWHYQMFCGLSPRIDHEIKDKDIVGRWRRFFGERINIHNLQVKLASAWQSDLPHIQLTMQDATVYESYVKYPTDVKLLWDCVEWVNKTLKLTCSVNQISKPRSKYKEQKIKYLSFCKKRRKTKKEARKRCESLLYLLEKLSKQLQTIFNQGKSVVENIKKVKPEVFKRLKTVRIILQQQKYHFDQPEKSVPNRIVSLHKPYLRPIVRGKENKPVEFGAKVHQMQVGGCNFIEHLDFNAFHEGNRLKKTVWLHNQYFGQVKQLAADGIYANNSNRKWCTKEEIATNFVPKGRQGTDKAQKEKLRDTLGVIRGTVLEGSFGNEKNHYLLRKVKAKTQKTEIVWIFFGVHCANAVKIAKRRQQANLDAQDKQMAA
jgi:transposase, IS5 family